MTATEISEAVAKATGEDIRTIARHGFSPLTYGPMELEDEDFHEPQMVDWDQLDLERYLAMCG